jgi:hypothetical protein
MRPFEFGEGIGERSLFWAIKDEIPSSILFIYISLTIKNIESLIDKIS